MCEGVSPTINDRPKAKGPGRSLRRYARAWYNNFKKIYTLGIRDGATAAMLLGVRGYQGCDEVTMLAAAGGGVGDASLGRGYVI